MGESIHPQYTLVSMLQLTTEQQSILINKVDYNCRRNGKRFLRDLGGTGHAKELDEQLAIARANPDAVRAAELFMKERDRK